MVHLFASEPLGGDELDQELLDPGDECFVGALFACDVIHDILNVSPSLRLDAQVSSSIDHTVVNGVCGINRSGKEVIP